MVVVGLPAVGAASPFGAIGLDALRQVDPALTGEGVRVAQVEAPGPGWQANPSAVGPRGCAFRWACAQGTATNFPNALGAESGHANEVGRYFLGVAPGVTQVDNFEAGYFTSQIIPGEQPIQARVVNQSFAYFVRSTGVDQDYDDYAARYNVLFVSGAGNTGRPKSPGTAYNSICVGAYGGMTSVGPISDGRSKPDLVAPAGYTSLSVPLVSGAASILAQAGVEDIRVMKALLLNGARKPSGWTNSATTPLDPRHGAGILNIYNSHRQWRDGDITAPGGVTRRRGWDLETMPAGSKDYFFEVGGESKVDLTATLVWLRQYRETNINNLDFALYRVEDGSLLASSRSAVDNVEHIHLRGLLPGSYRLQISMAGNVSETETFALAYAFESEAGPRIVDVRHGDGAFSARVIGEPFQAYQIQATTDFASWVPVFTGTSSAEGVMDWQVEGEPRFFRALALP